MGNRIYLVYGNTDQMEGKGSMVFDKAFSSWEVADQYAMSRYNSYGNGYKGWAEIHIVPIYDDVPDLNEEKRQKVLAKLTKEERELLGLNA